MGSTRILLRVTDEHRSAHGVGGGELRAVLAVGAAGGFWYAAAGSSKSVPISSWSSIAPARVPDADAQLTAANGMGGAARWAMSPAAYTPGTLVLASSSTSTQPRGAVRSPAGRPGRSAGAARWR